MNDNHKINSSKFRFDIGIVDVQETRYVLSSSLDKL